MILLKTSRLVLRAFVPEDRDRLVELDGDPEVRQYLDMAVGTTAEQAAGWIDRLGETYPLGSERGYWAAEEDGRFIGWFHLRPSRDTGECELGYRLRRDAWGQGLATEGSRALLELAGERTIARTMLENLGSQRVMQKLGMVRVREFLYDDRLLCVEYGTVSPHPQPFSPRGEKGARLPLL